MLRRTKQVFDIHVEKRDRNRCSDDLEKKSKGIKTLVFISVTQGDNEPLLGDDRSVNPEKNVYAWGTKGNDSMTQ